MMSYRTWRETLLYYTVYEQRVRPLLSNENGFVKPDRCNCEKQFWKPLPTEQCVFYVQIIDCSHYVLYFFPNTIITSKFRLKLSQWLYWYVCRGKYTWHRCWPKVYQQVIPTARQERIYYIHQKAALQKMYLEGIVALFIRIGNIIFPTCLLIVENLCLWVIASNFFHPPMHMWDISYRTQNRSMSFKASGIYIYKDRN